MYALGVFYYVPFEEKAVEVAQMMVFNFTCKTVSPIKLQVLTGQKNTEPITKIFTPQIVLVDTTVDL